MINITLLPLTGIDIENTGIVNLGSGKSQIKALLGEPGSGSNEIQFYYEELELRIDFDKTGVVEFIEFIYGPFPQKTRLSLYGIDPFAIGSSNLVALLTDKANGEVDDKEADFCYTFPGLSIGIWRQFSEASVLATINEIKEEGTYEENKEWLEEDLIKSQNFWTVGVGIKDYYN